MTIRCQPSFRFASMPARLGACLALAAAAGVAAPVQAVEPEGPQPRACWPASGGSDLECAFWICDFAATTGRLAGVATAAYCSAVTEQLKTARFGGAFEPMLVWWRENKSAQHQALDAALRVRIPAGRAGQASH